MRHLLICLCVLLILLTVSWPLQAKATTKAGTSDDFDSVEAVIFLLQEKGVIDEQEAQEFIRRHRTDGLPTGVTTPQKVYLEKVKDEVAEEVSEDVRKDVKKEILRSLAQRTSAFSSNWANRIRWGGDVRLRYQADLFDENNIENLQDPQSPEDPTELINTTEDRHRGRIRARLGIKAQVNNQVEAGVRIVTGNEDNPVSTNDNLGNFESKGVALDRVYLKWEPYPDNPFTDFVVWGGRIPNPFFSTGLVWDSDLNFEGAAVQYQTNLTPRWDAFINSGVFSIQEVEQFQDDKWLYAGQAGLEYSIEDPFRDIDTFRVKFGVAYYDYQELKGVVNDDVLFIGEDPTNDPVNVQFIQKGNTLIVTDLNSDGFASEVGLASDYRLVNLTGELDIGVFDPYHIVLVADYVKNIGFDAQDVSRGLFSRFGVVDVHDWPEETEGYALSLAVGIPKVRVFGDWKASLTYRRLERDAVLDSFTDSDFHLGGTNSEGWMLKGEFGLLQNVWLTARWISADEINEDYQPFSLTGPLAVDTFQLDINALY